jgi:FtsP/CotA-like multicopper oxidase with cupredoxin domain
VKRRNAVPLTLRILLSLLVFVSTLAATSAFAQTNPCPRFAAGSAVTPPEDIYSKSGVLTATLSYREYVESNGHTDFCYVDDATGKESPTLHVNPGDKMVLTLKNELTDSGTAVSMPGMTMTARLGRTAICGDGTMTTSTVNIHFHGANVSPTCHQDEVIHTLVNPGETFNYSVKIPANEPPGLYWYHPHVHGIADPALTGGASGAIIVEGIQNVNAAVAGLPQRLFVIRDNPKPPTTAAPSATAPTLDVSLNYVPVAYPAYTPPIISMKPGTKQFWRVLNASGDTVLNLQLQYDGVVQTLGVVALDGVPTGSNDGTSQGKTIQETQILLPPGGRAEFIVTAPATTVKNANFLTLGINTGAYGYTEPLRRLAIIHLMTGHQRGPTIPVVASAAGYSTAPPVVQRFAGLATAPPTAARTLYFSEDSEGFYITVNGQTPTAFNPDNPPAITTTQGSVEDWTIENHALDVHEFHIHQLHFLLLQRNGINVSPDEQQMLDTIQVPYWTGTGPYPSVKVRMDFRGPIVGQFVYHCHIMSHEDFGMMAIIQVNSATGFNFPGLEKSERSPAMDSSTSEPALDEPKLDESKSELNEPRMVEHTPRPSFR